jgi:acylphosphatase
MHGAAKVAHALSLTPIRGAPLPKKTPPKREPREELHRRAVGVRGIVQGVGFRPFVYRLAAEEQLAGLIGNDTDGVTIEIEGPSATLDNFLARLRSEAPPLARIDSVSVRELEPTGVTGFRIVASEVLGRVSTGIPADAATCPTACANCSRPPTAATAIPSSTAPTAARATPSPAAFPTTARRPPWRVSKCAPPARPSTTTRSTAAFTPSPMPAGTAARSSGSSPVSRGRSDSHH